MDGEVLPPQKHVDSPAIFVGGHSRTGTTLMQGLICGAERTIGVTREAAYFRQLIAAYELGAAWFEMQTYDYFVSREELLEFHRRLIEPYLALVAQKFGPGKIIVQKEPRMTALFPEIARLLPRARFIVMLRDLRDVVASQLNRLLRVDPAASADRGRREAFVNQEVKRFVDSHRRLVESRGLLRRRLLYVRYERLVFEPRETLREVFRFLDLPFREEMAEATWPIKRRPGEDSASELDGQPISSSPVGRFQSALDPTLLDSFARQMSGITAAVGVDCFAGDDPRNEKRFPNTQMVD